MTKKLIFAALAVMAMALVGCGSDPGDASKPVQPGSAQAPDGGPQVAPPVGAQ